MKTCQTGANLVVGLLDLLLGGCARDAEDLVEVLLAAHRGACVKGERTAPVGRLDSCEVSKEDKISIYKLAEFHPSFDTW